MPPSGWSRRWCLPSRRTARSTTGAGAGLRGVAAGRRVRVPLGKANRPVVGLLRAAGAPAGARQELKEILGVVDEADCCPPPCCG